MKQILKHKATFQVNIQNHDGLNKNHQGNKIRFHDVYDIYLPHVCTHRTSSH